MDAGGGSQRTSIRASLDQSIGHRQISKQARQRRQSTALNIANTLDALKERQVGYNTACILTRAA